MCDTARHDCNGTDSPWTYPHQLARVSFVAKFNVLKTFGGRVRDIRRQKGLSQEELARRAKIDRTYIGGIERGERNAGIKNVHRIADALGVPAMELFRDGGGNG